MLPLSDFDNRLRLQVARAVYGAPSFRQYAMMALPPVHIIVENGHVTLTGIVATDFEKNIAGIRASGAGLRLEMLSRIASMLASTSSPRGGICVSWSAKETFSITLSITTKLIWFR